MVVSTTAKARLLKQLADRPFTKKKKKKKGSGTSQFANQDCSDQWELQHMQLMLRDYMNEKLVKHAWIFQKLQLNIQISHVSPAKKDCKTVREIVRVHFFFLLIFVFFLIIKLT